MINPRILFDIVPGMEIAVERGKAMAILPEDRNAAEYQWATSGKRDFETALEERIIEPMRHDLLVVRNPDESVRFDDRKLRLDHFKKNGRSVTLYLAPTHFKEMKRTNFKGAKDTSFLEQLTARGREELQDHHGYLANGIAVIGVPVTKEGYATDQHGVT